MSVKYSGRIHDPNHILQDYDIYYNEILVSEGYSASDELIKLIERTVQTFHVPDSVKILGHSAFRACSLLNKIILPDGLLTINTNAIAGCTSLTEIYIPASVTNMSTSTFSGSSSLTKIYCGFREGSVSGAPWGAPENVDIMYNQDRPEGL